MASIAGTGTLSNIITQSSNATVRLGIHGAASLLNVATALGNLDTASILKWVLDASRTIIPMATTTVTPFSGNTTQNLLTNAVTDGTNIYLFGGITGGTPPSTIQIFNPVTHTFSLSSPCPLPPQNRTGTIVYLNGEIHFFARNPMNTEFHYSYLISGDSWSVKTTPPGVFIDSIHINGSGLLECLLFDVNLSARIYLYDGTLDTFTSTVVPSTAFIPTNSKAFYLNSQYHFIQVAGVGHSVMSVNWAAIPPTDAPVYPPGGGFGSWALPPSPFNSVVSTAYVQYDSNSLLALGGFDSGTSPTCYKYDSVTDTWTIMSNLAHAAVSALGVTVGSTVYLFGGIDARSFLNVVQYANGQVLGTGTLTNDIIGYAGNDGRATAIQRMYASAAATAVYGGQSMMVDPLHITDDQYIEV